MELPADFLSLGRGSVIFHRVFCWDFDGMCLEIRAEFPDCGYQCQD